MKEMRKVIAVIAAVGALAFVAAAIVSCVPPVGAADLEDAGGSPGISGPGIAVVISPSSGGGGGSGYSLIPSQIEASTTYYELAVRKINAGGTWEYRRTAARRGGTLAVAVDPGYQYELLVLGGFLPGDGKSPILLQSAFATTPAIGNTVHTENISLTKVDIDASRYEVTLRAESGTPQPGDVKKPFRAGGGAGVMELDLPKWETPVGSQAWLPKGPGTLDPKATVQVTVRGVAPLIQAYNAANGGNSADKRFAAAVPAYGTNGFFDPAPSFLPHLSLVALLEGETDNLYPLHTPWNLDMDSAQTLPGGASATDGVIPLTWDGIEAHSDDVWTPYDTDAKLYWDAYYCAFSKNDAALKFDRWKIQSGLDNSVDTLDGAGNTGGAVYVKIGAGGGAMLDAGGRLVIGIRQPVPKTWNLIPAGTGPGQSTFNGLHIRGIAYGGGTFVAGGNAKQNPSWSPDGIAWTNGTGDIASNYPYVLAYGNGTFVAGCDSGEGLYSTDGKTWTKFSVPPASFTGRFAAIAYGNGTFVAGSITQKLAYSTVPVSATSWSASTGYDLGPDGLRAAAFGTFGGGRFVAVSYYSSHAGWSDDGVNWTAASLTGWGSDAVNSIAYGGATGLQKFVAVGANGKIAYSADGGVTWEPTMTFGTGNFNKVIYAKGKFVAAGVSGIAWSYNGEDWAWATGTPAPANINTVAYSADCYVAGGNAGALYYSADGKIWTRASAVTGLTGNINDIIYADGKWVATTSAGQMAWCIPE